MAEKIEFNESVKENVNLWVENGRKVMRAGLGIFTLAQEETSDLFNTLVERGATTEAKTRETVNKMIEGRQKDAKKAVRRVEKEVEGRFENLLHWINVPSKNDIDKLSRKVSTLNKKVNDLSKSA